MKQLINEPKSIPMLLKAGIWISEKLTGKRMVPARLLSWSPRLAMGAAIFESLVVHKDPSLSQRVLKLVRMQVSLFVACPFCIDMNSVERKTYKITDQEIKVMQGLLPAEEVETLSEQEVLALELAVRLSKTPLAMETGFSDKVKAMFTDREFLVLTATAAQVNYWARFIQFLGVAPAGFTSKDDILKLKIPSQFD